MRKVSKGVDFKRIDVLPWSHWEAEDLAEVQKTLTKMLKTENGSMELRLVQARMLIEAHRASGLLAMVGVGHGKTLVSALLSVVLGAQSPVLLVPGSAVPKTEHEFEKLQEHFKFTPPEIVSYSALSTVKNKHLLDDIGPDLIIADEADNLKSLKSARTKRVRKYLKTNLDCKFCAMSGTMAGQELDDFAHLAIWALGHDAPVPTSYYTRQEWGRAINSEKWIKSAAHRGIGGRIHPGALDEWSPDPSEPDPLKRARRAVWNRMFHTKGVVMTLDDSCNQPIHVRAVTDITNCDVIEGHLEKLRKEAEGPNGEMYFEALEVARVARQIAQGYTSHWVPAPPEEWKEAQSAYASYCRTQIRKKRGDTPLEIAHKYPDAPEVKAWYDIRGTYKYKTEYIWHSEVVLDYAIEWLKQCPNGLIWTESVGFGQKLTERGVPYFGAGKKAAQALIHHEGAACLSMAHAVGANLQRYSDNLILSCTPNGRTIQQLMGRTHRAGQTKPVYFEFLAHTPELKKGLIGAYEDATFIEALSGEPQKILHADNSLVELLKNK